MGVGWDCHLTEVRTEMHQVFLHLYNPIKWGIGLQVSVLWQIGSRSFENHKQKKNSKKVVQVTHLFSEVWQKICEVMIWNMYVELVFVTIPFEHAVTLSGAIKSTKGHTSLLNILNMSSMWFWIKMSYLLIFTVLWVLSSGLKASTHGISTSTGADLVCMGD